MSCSSKLRHALRRATGTTRTAGTALLVAALTLGAAATASAASPRRIGSAPRIPAGAQALGAVSSSATVTATVALTPRDPAGLAAYAKAVSTPGSPLYHHFLSVAAFAQRFGATAAQADEVRAALAAKGLTVAPVSPNHLSLTLSAPAATVSAAFSTRLERYRLTDGQSGFANTSAPAVAASVSPLVQGVVGLNTLVKPTPQGLDAPQLAQPLAGAGQTQPQSLSGTGAQPCSAARQTATNYAGYTANKIASAYGLSQLYAQGDVGAGTTIALFELEPYSASDITAYQSCYGTHAQVATIPVDGGAGTGSGSGEAALDIEDVIGLAPSANVEVYEGPNTFSGALDTYQQIVSDDTAQVISTSWGLCEADLAGSNAAAVENTIFQEAAAQGQSVFAASGDSGADDCETGTGPAVDDPASQPYVTGVGGTTLNGSTPSATESVWNDGSGWGAGGGGVSSLWAAPAYQSGFALAQSSQTCGAGACRQVPDVSANADPNTGYVVYYGGWTVFGGTSAAAPTWAALTALADDLPACTAGSGRVGFANAALYTAAGTGYASDFKDIVSGGNGYDGVTGFSALTGYDMASGLGTPVAPSLAPAMCGDLVTVGSPGAQSSAPGAAQSLQLTAASTAGTAVTWQATGLPAGLTIAPATGQITGTPTTVGTYTVNVAAADASGSAGDTSFTWSVGAAAIAAAPAQPASTTDTTTTTTTATATATTTPTAPPATTTPTAPPATTTPTAPPATTTPTAPPATTTPTAPPATTPSSPVTTTTTTTAPAPPATVTTTTAAQPPADTTTLPSAPVATPARPASPAPGRGGARSGRVRITRSLRLDRHDRPILSLAVTAARGRHGIRRIVVSLPARLLHFTRAARSIALRDSRGHRVRAYLRVRGGTLTISFARAARTATLRLTSPALVMARRPVAAAAGLIRDEVRVRVTV